MSDPLLTPIRSALEAGDLALAAQCLLDSLYSSEAIACWHQMTRLPSAESIPHTLSFVSGFAFDLLEKTACVDLASGVLTFGVRFFLDAIETFSDLLTVLLHERGHILISLVYGSRMSSFKSPQFANLWEDVFINNTLLHLVNSDLFARTYADSHVFWRSLLCQHFTKWVAEQHEWLRFHLKPLPMRLIREVALNREFFSQKITYSEWMKIGVCIEEGLLDDPERRYLLDSVGSGDLLGDLLSSEDLAPPVIREGFDSLDVDSQKASGGPVSRLDTEGCAVRGQLVDMPSELPPVLRQVLHSFAPNECPPEFQPLLREMNIKLDIEKSILDSLVGDVLSRKQGEAVYEGRSANLERIHRRDMFWLAAGYDQTIWTFDLPVAKKSLKLYMDVSGSMRSFFYVMMLIHRHLSEWVDGHYQFSGSVVEVDPREPYLFSTGSTSYQAVADHILQEGSEEVIVLTDNTDTIDSETLALLKIQLRLLYLIQTREDGVEGGFRELATKTILLPALDA